MSLLTSPHQPPPPPPASASPSAVPNGPQSPKQQKEPLSHRFNEFMTSKPKIHCFRSLKRGVSSPLDTSLSFFSSFLALLYCTFCYVKTCFVWWMSPLCFIITCRQIQGIPTCKVICSQKPHSETTKSTVSDRCGPFLFFGRREDYPMCRKSSWTRSTIHRQVTNH